MEYKTIGINLQGNNELPVYCLLGQANIKINKIPLYRIIHIIKGFGRILINDKEYSFVSPAVFYINEEDTLQFNCDSKITANIIYFHPNVINSSFNFINLKSAQNKFIGSTLQDLSYIDLFTNKSSDKLKFIDWESSDNLSRITVNIFDALNNQQDEHWIHRTRFYLIHALFLVSSCNSFNTVKKENGEKEKEMVAVLSFITNNYDKKISLKELTRKFNINRTYLTERFQKLTGETVISYLVKLRINNASTLIKDTGLPLSEISVRVGFNDVTNFTRSFKKHMGATPSSYRKLTSLQWTS